MADPASAGAASRLQRPRQPMPDWVREALEEGGVMAAYQARPPYQRNDYLWWINAAKTEATRRRRLARMLDELRSGDRYMGMPWRGRRTGGTGGSGDSH